jgi:hypothetical protein
MPSQPLPAVRFVLDAPGERQVQAVRRWAGLGSAFAGLWLGAVADGWGLRLIGLASAAIGLAYGLSGRHRRPAAAAAAPTTGYLEVSPAGIELCEGAERQQLAWSDLSRAVLDEDRLAVRLERRQGQPLVLEAQYANAGVYDVFEAICAHGAAAGLAGCTRGSDD